MTALMRAIWWAVFGAVAGAVGGFLLGWAGPPARPSDDDVLIVRVEQSSFPIWN